METNETTEIPTVLDGEREVNVDNIKQLVTDIYTDPEMLKLLRSNLGLGESLGALEPEYGGITPIYNATLDFSGIATNSNSASTITSFTLPRGSHVVVITIDSIVKTGTQEESQLYLNGDNGPLWISSINTQDIYMILGTSFTGMINNHGGWEQGHTPFTNSSLSPYTYVYGNCTPFTWIKHIVVESESAEFNILAKGALAASITISGSIDINQ